MSQGQGNGETSARPKREVNPSRRAQEIIDAGRTIPGVTAPSTPADPILPQRVVPSSLGNRVPPRAKGSAKSIPGPVIQRPEYNGIPIPSFGPDAFSICHWQAPRPSDFLNLTDQRKAWKREIDQMEKQVDIDDGADDWHDFCGNRNSYPKNQRNGFALEYAVASTLKTRAKRAFRANKTWSQFAFEERTLDSESIAKTETDPKKKRILMEEALDNKLRIHIFDALKQRLCEEIWLEEYKDPPGLVQLKITQRPQVPDLSREISRQETTEAEAGRGIAHWSLDGYGMRQPVYVDEPAIPTGRSAFMRDMREQRYTAAAAAAVHAASVPRPGARLPRPGAGLPPMPYGRSIRGAGVVSTIFDGEVVFQRPLDVSDSENSET